jgi:ankyrin repeat protein
MGESPLMNVAAQDNVEACKKYISYGADINFATKDGQTALDIAIIAGARHTAEYLMSLGMEPTEATLNTMLEGASPKEIGYKRYGSVRFLVEELAKRDIPTGLDPAVEAAILGKSDVLIEACEKGGISPDTINWMGYNAAAFCSPDALAACISGGFSIYQEDEQDRPLVIAARYGNLENVQWLIENYQHNDGANIGYAFDAAVVNGWVETVRYFLSIGIQMQFWDSLTPLSNVASKGDLEMVKTLLGSGQNFPHDILWTATYRAATSTQYDTLEYLLANVDLSKDELQQIWTVSRRSLAQLQLCVKYGADPKDPEMLYNAAEYGRYDVAEYVIEMGTDPNSVLYEPALMRAVKNGYFDIAQLLVRHGADVDWQDSEGSILSWAAVTSYNITKLLLDAGADVELTAQNGNTPLMDAAAYNQVSCAKLLLEAGADPSIKNNAGKTAKDIAKERSHKALVKLLD